MCLFSAAFFGALGSSFIYGYNLSVVNAPASVSQTVDFYEMVVDSQLIPVLHQHHYDKHIIWKCLAVWWSVLCGLNLDEWWKEMGSYNSFFVWMTQSIISLAKTAQGYLYFYPLADKCLYFTKLAWRQQSNLKGLSHKWLLPNLENDGSTTKSCISGNDDLFLTRTALCILYFSLLFHYLNGDLKTCIGEALRCFCAIFDGALVI